MFVILAVFVLRENAALTGGLPSPSPEATQGAERSPASTESAIASPSEGAASSPTVVPEASLTGELPGADATVPPGVPVIPGLRIEAVVGLWQSMGLACESRSGSFPGTAGGYNVHCERSDPTTNVDVVADAVYWNLDGVQTISLSINSTNGEAIDGARVSDLLLPSAELTGGGVIRRWVEDRTGTASCAYGCTEVIDGRRLSLSVGLLGSHTLYIAAQATVQ
jgi:hypothetical protein